MLYRFFYETTDDFWQFFTTIAKICFEGGQLITRYQFQAFQELYWYFLISKFLILGP